LVKILANVSASLVKSLRAHSLQETISVTNALAEAVPLVAKGTIQPVIDSVFPLEDAHLESNDFQ